ncbi:cobalt-precorrin-5B (C(1))-methyltransferase [Mucilaginibacter aquaedulcis]|uniref:cobalt-precorrin-5B (C(1))-methyltransferase n=1 Tax=Mucilaginibacter aquaedulcis TaxID=1187081 RepID=UPI0025B2E758|nr:cobalt-precorrin-5B (C(1))-methyltransferase [Mucilaginibacter aquaedulcis]MDN3548213.1 cobalt-precorrin-5B (C(1))-methyltransferase [Mucilaginibacter aquaedulcis]
MDELQPIPDGPLKTGFTTGACATACSKAALLALILQQKIELVTITLPIGSQHEFEIISCSFDHLTSECTTQKDAGDDPDVTHGAIIGATVKLNNSGDINFLQGKGVGKVTLPGLEIGVGEPAINPVPRQMITNACKKLLADHGLDSKGVDVTIFVQDGEIIAKRTLNARLGIMGGISILGTTGIVTPFSASSYIASIVQGINVAVANGATELVINSGARSEKYLTSLFPSLPAFAFIHYGNWIGETLEKIAKSDIKKVNMGIMLGKSVKLAEGILDTHSGKSTWNKAFVHQLAVNSGYKGDFLNQILSLNMAGRLTELFTFAQDEPFYMALIKACHENCSKLIPNVELVLFLINKDGTYIKYA